MASEAAERMRRKLRRQRVSKCRDTEFWWPALEVYLYLVSHFQKQRTLIQRHIEALRQQDESQALRVAIRLARAEFAALVALLSYGEDLGLWLYLWGESALRDAVDQREQPSASVKAAVKFFGLDQALEKRLKRYRARARRDLDLGALAEALGTAREESYLRSLPEPAQSQVRAHLAGKVVEPEDDEPRPRPPEESLEAVFWREFDEQDPSAISETLSSAPLGRLRGLARHCRSVFRAAYQAEAPQRAATRLEDWVRGASSSSPEEEVLLRVTAQQARSELRRRVRHALEGEQRKVVLEYWRALEKGYLPSGKQCNSLRQWWGGEYDRKRRMLSRVRAKHPGLLAVIEECASG